MTLSLPPPVIFAHKETLHAIELPPLATFLSTLSIPDHLLKLNDILHRYRTPKSYQRVDVREVSSSELPLSSPEPEDEGTRKRRRREEEEVGEPVILEEGDSVDVPDEEDSTQIHPTPTDTRLTSTAPDQNGRQSKSPTPPTTVRPAKRTSTPPPHTLPPSGPKRRVRELRLDLRTLDAAALFALETWRREIMGLEKLGMEHPDSIWYKDATPTPTPSPSPEPAPVKRKRGRVLRDSSGKSQSRTPAAGEEDRDDEDVEREAAGANIVSPVGSRNRATPRRSQRKSHSQTPAAQVEGAENGIPDVRLEVDVDETAELDKEVVAGLEEDLPMADEEVNTKEAIQEGQISQEDIQGIEAFDTLVDGPANEEVLVSPKMAIDNVERLSPKVGDHNRKSPTPPASPDIILMDGFNRKDDDSDFSPERSPSPVLKRGRPSKNSSQSTFQAVPPPVVMGSSIFQAAPPPVAMSFKPHAGPPVASGSSSVKTAIDPRLPPHATSRLQQTPMPSGSDGSAFWFQGAPSPSRLASSSTSHAEHRAHLQPSAPSRTSPVRLLSLSPTRPPIPLLRRGQEGGTSDSPFTIPDSPEKRDGKSAFVPFVRQEMRVPTFSRAPVAPVRGLHWHAPEKQSAGKGKKRKEKEMEVYESRPAARRRSSTAKVHFAQEVSEEEEEAVMEQPTHGKRGHGGRRAGDSDDDEWADFRF